MIDLHQCFHRQKCGWRRPDSTLDRRLLCGTYMLGDMGSYRWPPGAFRTFPKPKNNSLDLTEYHPVPHASHHTSWPWAGSFRNMIFRGSDASCPGFASFLFSYVVAWKISRLYWNKCWQAVDEHRILHLGASSGYRDAFSCIKSASKAVEFTYQWALCEI
jgi:hypothetical protein